MINQERFDILSYWIRERERIRDLKERGFTRPWTQDTILQQYRFCNVNRDDDTVTRWIHENWSLPNQDSPMLPFALTVARMVNLPSTLSALGFPHVWDQHHFEDTLRFLKDSGNKVWTNAYMITGGYSKGGEPKEAIIGRVLSQVYQNLGKLPIVPGDTLEDMSEKIKAPGVGPFLSAQVIADLKRISPYDESADFFTWCAPGPGSTIGLNILHDRDFLAPTTPKKFKDEVNEIRITIRGNTGLHLDAQNTQNCLCEFNKYYRTKYSDYTPKTRYVPAVSG